MSLYFEKASDDHSDYMKMVSLLAQTTSKAKEMEERERLAEIKEQENEDMEIFTIVEKSAEFPGGMAAFGRWLGANLIYPEKARTMGVMGKVYVAFIVNADGSVSDVMVRKGIGAGCDEEVVRLMNICPDWTPGEQRGRAIKQQLIVPVAFNLQYLRGQFFVQCYFLLSFYLARKCYFRDDVNLFYFFTKFCV